jgi:sec-independent protein translocase protein TatB
MFGIDFSEILVIFGIALVVLGPEKLPRLARTVGRWIGRARAMARQFREQLEQEADALQRSADLNTPPHTTPPHTTPPPSPPPPAATAGAEVPEHHQQPAPPPAEANERTG